MNTIFKNAPQLRDNNTLSRVLILIVSVVSSAFLFAPVIVGFMSDFTQGNTAAYCIFKGLFALSLLICSAVFFVNRKIITLIAPCILGLITVIFPLSESVSDYSNIKSIADKFSFAQDYTAYFITMGIYLAYAILCLFSAFYLSGITKSSIVVLLMSVVSSLGTMFIAIDKIANYDTTAFDVTIFASATITTLIPLIAATACKRNPSKSKDTKRSEE